MRELIVVLGFCFVITLGLGMAIVFWEIPAPVKQKTVIISNEQFNK